MRKTLTFAVSAASLIIGMMLAATPAQADPTPPKDANSLISTMTLGQCQNVGEVIGIPLNLTSGQIC
ncbi:hypothetical protein GCM10022254_48340 [Actinomadura meridiana]|uniref:Secreted protein n=1 Tax=Actinomadura meridiana TaxID=559626 RepID=A0ABP8CBK0_9ACTN